MNILIYVPDIEQSWGGVRQYALGLIKVLSADQDNTYYIYHNINDSEFIDLVNQNGVFHLVTDKDVDYKPPVRPGLAMRGLNFFINRLNKEAVQPPIHLSHIDLLCRKYKIDIIHCPYQYIPHTKYAKLITTLHDVQELHFPEFFTPEARAARASSFLDYLTRADKIVVSYNHVKNDLIKYFFIDPQEIRVILLDMGKLWFERFSEKDIISISKFGISDKFVFLPANTWKHKNHVNVIRALALLRDRDRVKVRLVCSGHTNKHYQDEILPLIKELKVEDQVNFIGVVTEQELYSLYKSTLGVVVPTLYEAGSFPLMESILLKVPVICSNVTSLPETVNNYNCLFDPSNIEDIAEKLSKMWNSESFRLGTLENSEASGSLLKNTHALEKLMDMYKGLVS